MHIEQLLTSLCEMFIMIGIGYFVKKKGMLKNETLSDLTTLLLSVTLPLSIIASSSGSDGVDGKLLIAICSFALYYLISIPLSFLLFRKSRNRSLDTIMSSFGNTGFLGLPLCRVLFGPEGLMYAIMADMMYRVFMFTIGLKILGGKGGIKKIILNPLTITSAISVLMFITRFTLPGIFYDVFSTVGGVTVPLSMIIIGGWLVGVNPKTLFNSPERYAVVFLKLVVFPLVMYALGKLAGLGGVLLGTIVLMTSLPIGSLVVLFSEQYKLDANYANNGMLLSLVLSPITIAIFMVLPM